MKRVKAAAALGLVSVCGALPVVGAPAKPAAPASTPGAVKARITQAAGRGIGYLRRTQESDGSWQRYPGITSVCVLGLLRNGVKESDPAVSKAVAYLVALAKPDGGIYTDQFGPAQRLPNYNTALAITALNATRNPKYAGIIRRGQAFLAKSQFDEGEGFKPNQHQYGGIGYGSKEDNPDLSNLQNALEALKESGYPKNAEVFKKAIVFLQRCQNRSESNDQAWAGNDGGFIYAPSGESKVEPSSTHTSYGSMTYAGLKSYIYCSVDRKDPRVQAAWNWLRANYSVTENPKMGQAGLYYYYHTMSKTLAVLGDKRFVDRAGKAHPWATELSGAIIGRQAAEGSWKNGNPRWWEDRPALSTGYSLVALANCAQGL